MSVDVQLAVLADAANVAIGGKLNIFGEFNVIWSATERVQWPMMWYVAKITSSAADGHELRLQLRVVNDDEELVAGPVGIVVPIGKNLVEGVGSSVPLLIPIVGATFEHFGTYSFVLADQDGHEIRRIPLHIASSEKLPKGAL